MDARMINTSMPNVSMSSVRMPNARMTNVRMTWEEIQEKYPDRWVGLINVEYEPDNSATIKSAIVKYTDKSKGELTHMMLRGEIISRYTTPDHIFQLGMVEVHG